jgi:hypothetical protein
LSCCCTDEPEPVDPDEPELVEPDEPCCPNAVVIAKDNAATAKNLILFFITQFLSFSFF